MGAAEDLVERVRGGLHAYNSRDRERALAVLHEDCELILLRSLLDGTEYHGHEGYERFLADMAGEWEPWTIVDDEIRAISPNRVLVLGNFVGTARASGVEVDIPGAWLVTLEDGLVRGVRAYSDRARALSELGLS